jgi:hypothetical protein
MWINSNTKTVFAKKLTFKCLFQPWAWWIGAHYSTYNKRWCINILPMCTLAIIKPGGIIPTKSH